MWFNSFRAGSTSPPDSCPFVTKLRSRQARRGLGEIPTPKDEQLKRNSKRSTRLAGNDRDTMRLLYPTLLSSTTRQRLSPALIPSPTSILPGVLLHEIPSCEGEHYYPTDSRPPHHHMVDHVLFDSGQAQVKPSGINVRTLAKKQPPYVLPCTEGCGSIDSVFYQQRR